jgi:hypothetical protein
MVSPIIGGRKTRRRGGKTKLEKRKTLKIKTKKSNRIKK